MGWLECTGCALIAFGPPFSLFIFTVAKDPLRVILFIAGAFFWLLSLLLSALWWFAVVPLREHIIFGLVFSVAFQEVFRFIYFLLLKKAEHGLQKVSGAGMKLEGVHSLRDAKHTLAYVCGLGFGVMAGAFSLINVLADALGPGTPGFPKQSNITLAFDAGHGNYLFFLTSSVAAAAFILLHVFWNVIFWDGCSQKKYLNVVGVVLSHFLVSGLSLVNKYELYYVSLPITYLVLIATVIYAFCVAGGSKSTILSFLHNISVKRNASRHTVATTTAAAEVEPVDT